MEATFYPCRSEHKTSILIFERMTYFILSAILSNLTHTIEESLI